MRIYINKTIKSTLASLALLFSVGIAAQSATQQGTTHSTVNISANSQTQLVAEPWKQWRLTQSEWSRYQELLQSPRGFWSPKLDPIQILGIEARSHEEQQKYARLYVEIYDERVKKEIRFQQTLNATRKDYYKNVPVAKADVNPKADTYALFIPVQQCNDACRKWLNRGMGLVNSRGATLHVFLDGARTDEAVRAWAMRNSIPPRQIYDGNVVLHRGGNAYEAMAAKLDDPTLPMLVAITNDAPKKVIY